jgi:hypothetical protein
MGLFGWHTIPADAKEIVLTEGEYDTMAVYQATGRPAVSLPNGTRSLSSTRGSSAHTGANGKDLSRKRGVPNCGSHGRSE